MNPEGAKSRSLDQINDLIVGAVGVPVYVAVKDLRVNNVEAIYESVNVSTAAGLNVMNEKPNI